MQIWENNPIQPSKKEELVTSTFKNPLFISRTNTCCLDIKEAGNFQAAF